MLAGQSLRDWKLPHWGSFPRRVLYLESCVNYDSRIRQSEGSVGVNPEGQPAAAYPILLARTVVRGRAPDQ